MKNLSIIITLGFIISSCATIFSGSTQSIYIKAVDSRTNATVEDCACTVNDGVGMYSITSNPGTVIVKKGGSSLLINCKAPGYRQGDTLVSNSFNKTTLVNLIWWPGFIIDGVSGAYKKYPTHFVINMIPIKKTSTKNIIEEEEIASHNLHVPQN